MFNKVLIANRGEIAVRIIRACRELGIKTVAVYSEADRGALHTLLADKAVCIGPGPALDSYLNMARVLEVGYTQGCDALHPGYGFLSESSQFASATADTHMTFIGPTPEAMRLLGDKITARELMLKTGVPVVPGSEGEVRDGKQAARICADIGYPVMVKASAGGGGKGIRVIHQERDLEVGFRLCQAEARVSFGDPRVYLEKLVNAARHIEIQIIADRHGNAIHLGERDCSAQRRHQKFLEETPSPVVTPELRHRLGEWATAAATAANYTGAGTVEFLLDAEGNCYFIEVNCRLQVEHPITEIVTSKDVVREQILVAAGESVSGSVEQLNGHALECRICAENADADFEPCPGQITELQLPGGTGVRVDTHLFPGARIPPFYDSLIAKIIAWAPDRAQAIARMQRALNETVITGVPTTLDFQRKFLTNDRFVSGQLTTAG